MLDSVVTLNCLYCNMASKRNFLTKFQDITIKVNLGTLADFMRTIGIDGRQRGDNIKIKKKDGLSWAGSLDSW